MKNLVKMLQTRYFKYSSIIRKADINLINKDNSKCFSINIIDKDDMTFLLNKEAKKRNNRSLIYKIGNNYDELFNDDI